MPSVVKLGSTGPDVVTLQGLLNAYFKESKPTDGAFGPNTDASVKAFQKAKGLTADGVVGNTTWDALQKPVTTPVQIADNRITVNTGSPPANPADYYKALPRPTGTVGQAVMAPLIVSVSRWMRFDPSFAMTMCAIESGFDSIIKASTSSAEGLYQFLDGTWKEEMSKNGGKYGIPVGALQGDPIANAILGILYTKSNAEMLAKKINRPLTDTDLYTAHFMGPTGAINLLTSPPNELSTVKFLKQAKANPSIFYKADKVTPRTCVEVIAELDRRVQKKRVVVA